MTAEPPDEGETDVTRPMDPDRLRPSDDLDRTMDATPTTAAGDAATVVTGRAERDLPEIPDLEIEDELGRGGMGVVYRGRQTYIDRPVAVKVLLVRGTPSEDQFLKRFQREARLLAKFDHPHIVKCYQAGMTAAGSPYLVMEYVDGCSLRQWIDREGPLDQRHALLVARDVAQALGHAHEHGIMHRDVKPENVLLQAGREGDLPFVVKLADLGLARPGDRSVEDTSALTAQGMVLGTPATMAPEQFDDPDAVDFRCDIYGLGCVLHHALSGRPAFTGKTLSQLLKNKVTQAIPDTAACSGCAQGVAALVAWCLQPEREHRPAGYDELIARIDQQLAALGTGATKAMAPPPVATGGGRRAAPAIQLGLLGLAVVALSVAGVALVGRETPPPAEAPPPMVEPPEATGSATPATPDDAADPSGSAGKTAIDPRTLEFAPGEPLWAEDFATRLADWTHRPPGHWASHDQIQGAIFGLAMGRRPMAMISRELPPPPWRIQARLAPMRGDGIPPMREAGLWLRVDDDRGVGLVLQSLGATELASLRERTGVEEPARTQGAPRSLQPVAGGHLLSLIAGGGTVVAAVDGEELGSVAYDEIGGLGLRVEGGGVEVTGLELARPVE